MSGIENQNNVESVEKIPEVENENKATENIAEANNDDVHNAVEDINSKRSPMEYFGLNKLDQTRKTAAENVIKKICGKENLGDITMEDVFKLPSVKKAILSWEISAIQPLKGEVLLPLKSGSKVLIDSSKFNKFFYESKYLTEEAFRQYVQKETSWELKEADNLSHDLTNRIQNNIREQAKSKYFNMFKTGEQIEPRTDVKVLATGDLSGTSGIGGGPNIGRQAFEYNFRQGDTIESTLMLGQIKSDAEISISAEGIDGQGGSFDISFGEGGNRGIIHGEYTEQGLKVGGNFPDGVKRNDGILTIPQKYKDTEITVTTRSNQYSSGSYDEVMFAFAMKNAKLVGKGIAESGKNTDSTTSFELGEHEFSQVDENKLTNGIEIAMGQVDNSFATEIPVIFSICNDATPFKQDNINKYMEERKNLIDINYIMGKSGLSNNDELKQTIAQAFNDYSNKVENKINNSNNPKLKEQKEIQKLLAQCRFSNAIVIALKNKQFENNLSTGKIKIETNFDITKERKVNVFMNSEDLIAIKK